MYPSRYFVMFPLQKRTIALALAYRKGYVECAGDQCLPALRCIAFPTHNAMKHLLARSRLIVREVERCKYRSRPGRTQCAQCGVDVSWRKGRWHGVAVCGFCARVHGGCIWVTYSGWRRSCRSCSRDASRSCGLGCEQDQGNVVARSCAPRLDIVWEPRTRHFSVT